MVILFLLLPNSPGMSLSSERAVQVLNQVEDYVIDAGGGTIHSSNITSVLGTLNGKRLVLRNASSILLDNLTISGIPLLIDASRTVVLDNITFTGNYSSEVVKVEDITNLHIKNSLYTDIEWNRESGMNLLYSSNVSNIELESNEVKRITTGFISLFFISKGRNVSIAKNLVSDMKTSIEGRGYPIFDVVGYMDAFIQQNTFTEIGNGNELWATSNMIRVESERATASSNILENFRISGILNFIHLVAPVVTAERNVVRDGQFDSGTMVRVGSNYGDQNITLSHNTVYNISELDGSDYQYNEIFRVYNTGDVLSSTISVRNNNAFNIRRAQSTSDVLWGINIIDSMNTSVISIENNSFKSIDAGTLYAILVNTINTIAEVSILDNTISDINASIFYGISSQSGGTIENNIVIAQGKDLEGVTIYTKLVSIVQGNSIDLNSTKSLGVSIQISAESPDILIDSNNISAKTIVYIDLPSSTNASITVTNNEMIGDVMIRTETAYDSSNKSSTTDVNFVCENNTFNGYEVGCLFDEQEFIFGVPIRVKTLENVKIVLVGGLIIAAIAYVQILNNRKKRRKQAKRIARYESKYKKKP